MALLAAKGEEVKLPLPSTTMLRRRLRASSFPPRRPSSIIRYVGLSLVLLAIYYLRGAPSIATTLGRNPSIKHDPIPPRARAQAYAAEQQHPLGPDGYRRRRPQEDSPGGNKEHPIDELIRNADQEFRKTLSKESRSLEEAAARYRERRGRHPPPGFDSWYRLAAAHRTVIVEDFWDQIYTDLEPFWGLPPAKIRKEAWDYEMTINVRNGTASAKSDWFWTQLWLDMIRQIEEYLPDMDIALNAMDEPRIVTPWEEMDKYMAKARETKKIVDSKEAVTNYSPLPTPGKGPDGFAIAERKKWESNMPYWEIARRGCPPDSPARTSPVMTDFNHEPYIIPSNAEPHMYRGFVSNYTMSTSICHQPDLQGLHGIFIEPLSVSSTQHLFPMFGGSKLSVNNEILLPAPMYWSGNNRFAADGYDSVPWDDKRNNAFWRGVATGGWTRETNWRGFQRHRFIAMNNGTALQQAEMAMRGQESPALEVALPIAPGTNFAVPDKDYNLAAQTSGRLGNWTDSWADMSFTDLNCQPPEPHGQCHYTGHAFTTSQEIFLSEMFQHKYLPDVDGNSFSGRYLGFLRSTSLPLKSTLFREWHDSRLVAWKHFVPMDARFGDWHAIMDYFLGYPVGGDGGDGRGHPGHDEAAERIAMAGKEWAELVLRPEDMLLYVLRLLLEYARVSDEKREKMGFVEDLLPKQG